MAHLTEPVIIIDWMLLPEERAISNSTPVLDSAGTPATGRTVWAVRQDTAQAVGKAITQAGEYEIRTRYHGPVYVIADGEPNKKALIVSGVIPS